MRPAGEGDLIYSQRCPICQPSAELGTVIDQFYKYRRYSVTITLQIEKYSLSFANIGPDAPWQIKFEYGFTFHNEITFHNETQYVESISVVDTLDVTRNLDVFPWLRMLRGKGLFLVSFCTVMVTKVI